MTKFFFQTVYVMPSSSARCSQLPRAVDKVPFYASLKKLRDYLRGDLKELDDSEVCFPDLELKVVKKEHKQEIKEEVNNSCAMQNIPYSQSCESGYPSTNMHIKQEPVYNQSQYDMQSNPNSYQICRTTPNHNQPPTSYCNTQSNFDSSENGNARYQQMMCHSDGDNAQNFKMVQRSMGDNSFQMSQMQGQQSQNFQMFQGQMQSYNDNNSSQTQTMSFQQSVQMSGLSGQSSGQIMVQSSFLGQGQQFPQMGAQNFQSSNNYQQNMGNYMNYQNQQPNFDQQNPSLNQNPNIPRTEYDNGGTFTGFTQGQGQSSEGQYQYCPPASNFIKQEPKDFTECQNSSSCNGQESAQPHAGRGMNITGHQGQGQISQNGLPPAHIKEEPKEYGNYSNSACQNR